MKRTLITVVVTVVVVLALIMGIGWTTSGKSKNAKGPTTKVRLDSPIKGDLAEIVSAPGRIEPKTSVSISARISARITELPFEEGDRVTKGDPNASPPIPGSVLVRLDATDLEATLLSVEAQMAARTAEIKVAQVNIARQKSDIRGIEATLSEAKRNLARQEKLREYGDVSQSAFDQAVCTFDEISARLTSATHTLESQKLNVEVAQHRLKSADAEITKARDRLSYTTITSPIDGIVTAINAEVGELVITGTMNNQGTVLMEVADLSEMLMIAEVDESDIGGLKPGQKAAISIRAYPDEVFEGVVDFIAMRGMAQRGLDSRDFQVKILLDDSDKQIYPGLSAEVEIETYRHQDVLKVPSQAVLGRRVDELPSDIRDDNPDVDTRKEFTPVVYRNVDGNAVVTPVTIGPSDLTHTVILSGLAEDDQVVTGPYKVLEKLKHDKKIEDEAKPKDEPEPETKPAEDADEAVGKDD